MPKLTCDPLRRRPPSLLLLAALAAFLPVAAIAQGVSLDPDRGVLTMAPLLERATPAVVNISVLGREAGSENPLFSDPFFRRFFDLPAQPEPRRSISAGSGVIVDARRGLVLTNHHVVRTAERITVTLKDRRDFTAELVGSDPATDIALLRIPADSLTALKFGDSDRLEVGDLVVAIGNPFGLGQTVTSGIVSALGRSGITNGNFEDFIQTDASINPGNSGGALINSKGELVGINTAILAPSGGNVGIGFAVPASMARSVMDQLLRFGSVRRGRIGVVIQDLEPDAAEQLGLAPDQGALIARVEPGSPAEQAGIRAGDVVLTADGHPVRGSSELRNRIGLVEAEKDVRLEILRSGRRQTLSVRVTPMREAAGEPGGEADLAGARLQPIPPEHPAYGRIDGVLVAAVRRGSAAAAAGIRRGDIVLGVDGRSTASVAELENALSQASGPVRLDLLRGGRQLAVVLQ
ncbi:MAG: Do family serine endopeptidase [Geminicoccaceae bacterium]